MVDISSLQPCLLLPKHQAFLQRASCRLSLNAGGPHMFMQTFSDVGGCDCWIGSYWEGNHQWWVGWHSPNNVHDWAWPSDEWVRIGYARWYCSHRGKPKVLEAFYAIPNPRSRRLPCHRHMRHWHIVWDQCGHRKWQQWIDSPLVEEENLYLKGGRTGPKGNFHTTCKGQGKNQRHVNGAEQRCQTTT